MDINVMGRSESRRQEFGRFAPQLPRVAVVGCGYWGLNLVRNVSLLEHCELRAICDLDPKRLAEVRRKWPIASTDTDARAVCEDPNIDAVVICTPVGTHYELARTALAAGKHVLVEKPLTHSVETAERLVDLAQTKKLVLQVDHTFVYSGAVREIRSIIDGGKFGDPLYFDSVYANLGVFQPDVNVVWDLAPHGISILTFLIDERPRWVSATGCAHYGNFEDIAYVTIGFSGSLLAHLHVNWLAPVKLRSTLIGGSKQMIVYDDLEPSERIRVYDKGVVLVGDDRRRTPALVDYRVGGMYAPNIDKTEPLAQVCAAFIDAINDGTRPVTDGVAGLEVVRILEAAHRSIENAGQRITL
jgi:predicted dehydrogenase